MDEVYQCNYFSVMNAYYVNFYKCQPYGRCDAAWLYYLYRVWTPVLVLRTQRATMRLIIQNGELFKNQFGRRHPAHQTGMVSPSINIIIRPLLS